MNISKYLRLHVSHTLKVQSIYRRCVGSEKPRFMDENSAKHFHHMNNEQIIYQWWESSGFFSPNRKHSKNFTVPMPPPNVTGHLHMGHAIFVTLQDIMIRFHRMRGFNTLWVPGTDHAGIATQLVVEKMLLKEGVSRESINREAFMQRAWQWKEESGDHITQQMRRLGASADWSREKFTLDADMSESVVEAFMRLHERGLVYRGEYLVNWSPHLQTAVSDLEVEHSEEDGLLYVFKYVTADGSAFLPVATTRPETILGDTAVCVHPLDERYSALVGSMVRVPLTDRLIPVIADEYVDMAFGTGALKITPGHDPADWALSKKHALPVISLMRKDGSMNEHCGAYCGLDRFDCRREVWTDLERSGLALRTEPHRQRVPRSQRGGEVVEPMLSTQWFVRTENMAARAAEAVRSKEMVIVPERFEKVWFNWLGSIHDWCISRQLWWGHRIPVYYICSNDAQCLLRGDEYVVARSLEEAEQLARQQFGPDVTVRQETDVLDTWFSSGLWPFATVGWPSKISESHGDWQRHYPASVLETGHDILFFWVARMAMLGLELTGRVPFKTVYLHGLVRDAEGHKMSKSRGNVIDPIDTIDAMGSDALRYSLSTGSTPGQDLSLSADRLENSRNFVNKLWNAGKYIGNCLAALSEDQRTSLAVNCSLTSEELRAMNLSERYIVSRCHELTVQVTAALEALRFGEAGALVYNFLWGEFADWYIEVSKARMRSGAQMVLSSQQVLVYVWDSCLRLLHPFMPFLTETLWQLLPHEGESLMMADWPQRANESLFVDSEAIRHFGRIQALVVAIRNLRNQHGVEPGKKTGLRLRVSGSLRDELTEEELDAVCLLARVDRTLLVVVNTSDSPLLADEALSDLLHVVVDEGLDAFIPQDGLVDKVKEAQRLDRQCDRLRKMIVALQTRVSSPAFVLKAPPEVVAAAQLSLSEAMSQLSAVEKSKAALT